MKKILIGIVVVMVVAGVFALWCYRAFQPVAVTVPPPVATSTPIATTTPVEASTGSPKDATYTIEGNPVTLVNGMAETPAAPSSTEVVHTEYFGNDASYDFNHDGRPDSVSLLTQSTGGTGVFYYVVAALNLPQGYLGSAGVRLGDRIAPQTTTVDDTTGVITVNYADRLPTEPFTAAPSIGKTLRLQFDASTRTLVPIASTTATTTATTLMGKKWEWVRTTYTSGKVFTPKKASLFSLTFGTDGTVSGTTDCNSVGGPYTTSGTSTLAFGALATTLMACEGSEESTFTALLGQVTGYTITSKGELHLSVQKPAGTAIFN